MSYKPPPQGTGMAQRPPPMVSQNGYSGPPVSMTPPPVTVQSGPPPTSSSPQQRYYAPPPLQQQPSQFAGGAPVMAPASSMMPQAPGVPASVHLPMQSNTMPPYSPASIQPSPQHSGSSIPPQSYPSNQPPPLQGGSAPPQMGAGHVQYAGPPTTSAGPSVSTPHAVQPPPLAGHLGAMRIGSGPPGGAPGSAVVLPPMQNRSVSGPPMNGHGGIQTPPQTSGRYPSTAPPPLMPQQPPSTSYSAASGPAASAAPGMGVPPPVTTQPGMSPQQQLSGQNPPAASAGVDVFDLFSTRHVLPTSPVRAPVPPLPDQHRRRNCSTKIIRSTLTKIPTSQTLLRKTRLPFGVSIYPYGTDKIPSIESTVITRCRSCRTYMNPFVTFLSHGRRWRCNMCFRVHELPTDFDYDPVTRKHVDRNERAELNYASVEYVAPSEYMVRPPQPCIFMFLIDVSKSAMECGMVKLVCDTILENLDNLAGDTRTKVGFVTFDDQLHFYNLESSQSSPRMMVVSDVTEPFIPAPKDLVVNLRESRDLVETLLKNLPSMFKGSMNASSCLAEALRSTRMMVEHIGARITVFQVTPPNVGEGKVKPTENVSARGTSAATKDMEPTTDFYKQFSVDSSRSQIGIDLFLFPTVYADLSTLSQLVKFAAGMTYYYESFNCTNVEQAKKVERELSHYLTRPLGLEAVLRVRATKGLVMNTFHGHFFVRSADLLALPNVSPDNAYTFQVTLEDEMPENQPYCYFQVALLYTSSNGERRIRVHTAAFPTANTVSEIFEGADAQALAALLSKMAVDRALSTSLTDARDALLNVVADSLKAYREMIGGGSGTGSQALIAPGSLKYLPLYILGLLKNPAFTLDPSVHADARTVAMMYLKVLPIWELKEFIYPRMYALHNMPEGVGLRDSANRLPMPAVMQCGSERMERCGIYLIHNTQYLLLYMAKEVSPAMCTALFGVEYPHVSAGPIELPKIESDLNKRCRNIVRGLRSCHPRHLVLLVVKDESHLRNLFLQHLIDDKNGKDSLSYYEMLQELQKRMA